MRGIEKALYDGPTGPSAPMTHEELSGLAKTLADIDIDSDDIPLIVIINGAVQDPSNYIVGARGEVNFNLPPPLGSEVVVRKVGSSAFWPGEGREIRWIGDGGYETDPVTQMQRRPEPTPFQKEIEEWE